MRRIALLFLLLNSLSHAIFVNATLQDSRIVNDNSIYKPEGIVGFALEAGFFNEPENRVDYTLALGVRRFGYSFSNGDETVDSWAVEFKPLMWSITLWDVSFETFLGAGTIFAGHQYNNHNMDVNVLYGYRLGYRICPQLMAGISYTELYPLGVSNEMFTLGGWGLNLQYSLPW